MRSHRQESESMERSEFGSVGVTWRAMAEKEKRWWDGLSCTQNPHPQDLYFFLKKNQNQLKIR